MVSGEIVEAGPTVVPCALSFAVHVPQGVTDHGVMLSARAGIATQVKSATRISLRNMPLPRC
jgi:hypothetical protein